MRPVNAICAGWAIAAAVGLSQVQAQEIVVYNGRCDASAAAALDADHFIVANDEDNRLQIYRRGNPDPLGAGVDLSAFLDAVKESDLEGSATAGSRIYWISSHGRNKEGKFQERRHRFFATDIAAGTPPSVKPVGAKPYTKLLDDMLADAALKPLLEKASKKAPEAKGGLNIEGLAATPDGKLLIGFRSPIPKNGALIAVLENPGDVLDGKTARFGAPIFLKGLGKSGIRSIELVDGRYAVVSGPPADKGRFALHRWSGKPDEAATPVGIDFRGLRPEALFVVAPGMIQVLSDDGGVKVKGKECKDLPEDKQTFRSMLLKP